MATKEQREAAQLAQVTAALEVAVRDAVTPLVLRIEALETALAGARTAFKTLRAQVQPTRVEHRVHSTPRVPVGEWNKALNSLRDERGLHATAFVPRADVLAKVEELRQAAAEQA